MIEHATHDLTGKNYAQVAAIVEPAYIANANEVLAAIDAAVEKLRVLRDNEVAQFGEVCSPHMNAANDHLIDARVNLQLDLDAFLDSIDD